MTAVITWGTLTYPETQVLEYAPSLLGKRISEFSRIANTPLLYLTGVPLKGYRVKLLFNSWDGSSNTANSALSKYEELETKYLAGTTHALTVGGRGRGEHVIERLESKFPYCAQTGTPYIVEVDVTWREDPLS